LNLDTPFPDTHQKPIETVEQLEFTVSGRAIPQGSKKGFIVGRRVVLVDDNKDLLKPWRATVRDAAEMALAGRTGFTDAVYMLVDFHLPRPKSVRRKLPTVPADLDKLIRAIGDALTDSGAVKDDSLIVTIHANKVYADDKPFVRIKLVGLA